MKFWNLALKIRVKPQVERFHLKEIADLKTISMRSWARKCGLDHQTERIRKKKKGIHQHNQGIEATKMCRFTM